MSVNNADLKNYFELIGKSKEDVEARINDIFSTFFLRKRR